MEKKNITVTAVGKNRLDILNRITLLFIQRNIPVRNLEYTELESPEYSKFTIHSYTNEDSINKIVNQIRNIVEISQVEYTF